MLLLSVIVTSNGIEMNMILLSGLVPSIFKGVKVQPFSRFHHRVLVLYLYLYSLNPYVVQYSCGNLYSKCL